MFVAGTRQPLALPVVVLLVAAAGPVTRARRRSGRSRWSWPSASPSASCCRCSSTASYGSGCWAPSPNCSSSCHWRAGSACTACATSPTPAPTWFSAGAVLTATTPEAKEAFEALGEALAELAKFAALLVFGALLTPRLFADLPWQGYVAVVLAIVLIQAWFGPKGFESVVCMPFSIVAHSSTDVLIARMFDVEGPVGIPDDAHDTKTGEIEPERKAAL